MCFSVRAPGRCCLYAAPGDLLSGRQNVSREIELSRASPPSSVTPLNSWRMAEEGEVPAAVAADGEAAAETAGEAAEAAAAEAPADDAVAEAAPEGEAPPAAEGEAPAATEGEPPAAESAAADGEAEAVPAADGEAVEPPAEGATEGAAEGEGAADRLNCVLKVKISSPPHPRPCFATRSPPTLCTS